MDSFEPHELQSVMKNGGRKRIRKETDSILLSLTFIPGALFLAHQGQLESIPLGQASSRGTFSNHVRS